MKIPNRAQIEVSFHWIFILIAGAAILAFFLIITKHEKEGADINIDSAVGKRLEALFSTIQQMPDSIDNETLKQELEFRCQEDGHTYTIKGGERRFNLYSQVIFSPETVGDGRIITWTKIYSTPFPAAQILYLSDEKTQYIFVKEDAEDLYNIMPDLFEKKLVENAEDVAMIRDEGFRKYVIIAESTPTLDPSMTKKTTIVNIGTPGKVTFKNLADETTMPYSNQETLFGAIITGNPELYGCAMEKLMHVSRITGEINLNRTGYLAATTNSRCQLFYSTGLPQEYIQNIIENSNYPADNYIPLNQAVTSLSNLNRELARANCPTIY